jgi:imidazolonepropionase-like amidohydrolase
LKIIQLPREATLAYGSLWDGGSLSVCGPGTLFISKGKITTQQENAAIPQTTHNLSAYTLLPALIDCHVHLMLPDGENNASPLTRGQDLLHAGVAAVRDAGSKDGFLPKVPLLTCVCTGQAISKAGYYGSNLGLSVIDLKEACRAIDRLAEKGAAQIKLIASDIFSFNQFGKTGPVPFCEDELRRIASYAAERGLPVMAHANGDEAVRNCVNAGIRCIEHGYFMSEETLEILAAKSVYWVPTLAPVAAWLENRKLYNTLSKLQQDTVRRSLTRQKALVAKARNLGVHLGAGTDAGAPGVPHGPSLVRELELLHECGLSPREALLAATRVAASICRLPELGELSPGKKAVILAVKSNPLECLNTLHDPAFLLSS